jgi:uncharacterized protein YndB with AHSA1/START domain
METKEMIFSKDIENKKINVVRAFDAPLESVWNAWTESDLLDQWWAPKPYRAETKTMDFREGGFWLYAMVGPEGDHSWCKETFKTIVIHKSITNQESFCDEEGVVNSNFPMMYWNKKFDLGNGGTIVSIEITFESVEDIDKLMDMGFKEGFEAGLNNLDELLTGN